MIDKQTLVNRYGEPWEVEHYESERLTHIGGYLMTHRKLGRVTLSTKLSSEEQARGRSRLLNHLTQTPINTSGVLLWHPDDE